MSAASDFFVLRVPLLPLDVLGAWTAAPSIAPSAVPPDAQPSLAAHVAYLRASYRALLADPVVREAILVASPDLDTALDAWMQNPDAAGMRDVERALTRYLTRMASRPTPFGLFGSVAAGRITGTTSLVVAPHAEVRRHTRLDVDYLGQVIEALVDDPRVRPWLRYRLADTACRIAGSWRYVETRVKDKARTHHLVAIEDNEAVSTALARAASGATASELADAVRDVGVDDAEAFATALIESRILQPDLACPVTGVPVEALLTRLSSIPGIEPMVTALTRAAAAIHVMDAGPLAAGRAAYQAVARTLEPLPAPVELARLFQVDTARPAGATLGPDALALLRQGAELLEELAPDLQDDEELGRVKRAWSERFEERDVPLLEAIDADAGIGSELGSGARGSSALIEGLRFPDTASPTAPWGEREKHLLSLAMRAAAAGAHEVELTDADRRVLRRKTPLARTGGVGINATLVAQDGRPHRVVVRNTVVQPTARLIGRFCHLAPEIDAGVRGIVAAEEALEPDAVHAEIVHLPEGRAGNVILRPVLRAYEIPAMGASGIEPERQIPLSDLTVQLVGHRFTLRSTRLRRRVIPRMTTAHNFAGWSVGAYRFLCLAQADGQRPSAYWSWGPLEASPFLPRVRVGNVVLSRASWRISKPEILALQKTDLESRWRAMQQLRTARAFPRWIVLSDYDNELVVDLENALAVDSLVQLLKPRDEAALLEWYPSPDESLARGPEGAYACELIVPMLDAPVLPSAAAGDESPSAVAVPARGSRAARSFLPGSEWVFAKVYGGSATSDPLLTDIVGPVSRALLEKRQIERWFFIRYADPGEHLRWRVQVAAGTSPSAVRRQIERALATAVERQFAWRVTFDTYDREVERYGGGDATGLAERWFHADSDAVVEILREVEKRGDRDDRWLATILSIDRLLTDLGLDLETRARAMREARERFGAEFKVDGDLRRALGDRLRPVAKSIDSLLTSGPARGSTLASVSAALLRRSRQSRRTFASLQRSAREGRSSRSVYDLSFSYVHMAVNRLIRSEARMHELVLYDFLAQTYSRQLARARAGHSG